MARSQRRQVSPPAPVDIPALEGFASIIQSNMADLFGAAHTHGGINGVVLAFPKETDGNAGDILVGFIGGSAYLLFKTDTKNWYKILATHV